ncbi:hypothetical protein [Jannaschia rubra]|uniref:Uncharacterized protein n=1 Tax=Jannaschia rubra TaxID=282197 RepID=A0A0M6XRN4_9RHOB|nr:hypothetical protein [Jannaschia rubra]CTQ33508.1 hypothetical protein JAN5088_02290 [Jannaschia rubra]SFG02946.1 hypothetical protein SAMN04488517_102337 [Jannaschia rubra]
MKGSTVFTICLLAGAVIGFLVWPAAADTVTLLVAPPVAFALVVLVSVVAGVLGQILRQPLLGPAGFGVAAGLSVGAALSVFVVAA